MTLCTHNMCPGFFANDFVPYHTFLRLPKQRVTIHQRIHVEHRDYSPTAMYEGISSCFCSSCFCCRTYSYQVRVFSRGIFSGGFPLYDVLCTHDMCPGFFANDFVPHHPFLRVPKQRVTIHQRVHVEHRDFSPTAMYEGISSCFCCRT